jgi:hypothetical protein
MFEAQKLIMFKRIGLKGLLLLAVIAISNVSFMSERVTIFHQAGDGNWTIMHVPPTAVAGHGQHGDLFYHSCCPCSGEEFGCK